MGESIQPGDITFRTAGGTTAALAVAALATTGCYSWVRYDLAPPPAAELSPV